MKIILKNSDPLK